MGKGIIPYIYLINPIMETDHSALQTQIEYYLSDANLEHDKFFHFEVENASEGYLALDLIMNCNKIKKLKANYADCQNAVAKSSLLELNSSKDSVRRKGNKPLPEFKGKGGKFEMTTRLSRKNSEKSVNSQLVEDSNTVFVPLLLVITDVSTLPKNGKLIEETIGEQYKMKVPYARVNKSNGHLVFDKNVKESSEVVEKL